MAMKKILIRTDMNKYIATGHVMRCLSIADAAVDEGCQVLFVSSDNGGRDVVKNRGYDYISLGTVWNRMEDEIDKLYEEINRFKPDCILVDSYYVTDNYMGQLKKICKTAYIDDLGNCIYPCDILICYANYYEKFMYHQKYVSGTRLLLGCSYTPLRKVFSLIEKKEISHDVREILLMSGGTDSFHIIQNLLDKFMQTSEVLKNVHIVSVCGRYNDDYESISKMYENDDVIEVVSSVNNIEEYMTHADIAVSAAGTTLYELCACGVPTICYTIADNQVENALSFDGDDMMINAGDLRESGTIDKIFDSVINLMRNYDKRVAMSKKMLELVDGHGASRIVKELIGKVW